MSDRDFPSDTADKFVVRLPDGMRSQIAEAAKANNRSMNAEIVSRLADSFVQEQHVAQFGHPHTSAPPGINVILDSRGYPISWDEISEHLAAIRKTGKFNVVAMHTSVITPDLTSSTERAERAEALHEFYKGKSATKRIRRTKPDDSNP
ncbi:Arc-like DNA binding domain protein [Burkholderia multivorans]|uniref:Arc family DNA-binding protein n=1 Tax=Burkholderia multivorans TaxID=87883 RepID=UPI000CFFEC62|nr:Arc family DNA-binding protein [Burkholderia multivorans]PRE27528.1 hypothetical protein C6P79_14490 [Burkholderia multivorans]CAB5279547.1 Arc-like DNA binding domain protein [Burkholderia multivorans]CAB5285902.1 Arc-like DNA binding domain protein [Burkholderia multivorans]CAB5287598.1 Arc-like DNA binding domain protein [Burkholderia multivorans]CAB5288634.1 Arc-like DNA binding domain protein [Burkholderia multivorans]